MKYIRWLLIVPISIVSFYFPLLLMMLIYSLLSDWCPWGEPISGLCPMPLGIHISLICVGAALAAALIVVLGSFTAPTYRARVAWILYACGSVVALFMAYPIWQLDELYPLLSALLSGFVSARFISRSHSRCLALNTHSTQYSPPILLKK